MPPSSNFASRLLFLQLDRHRDPLVVNLRPNTPLSNPQKELGDGPVQLGEHSTDRLSTILTPVKSSKHTTALSFLGYPFKTRLKRQRGTRDPQLDRVVVSRLHCRQCCFCQELIWDCSNQYSFGGGPKNDERVVMPTPRRQPFA